MGSRLWIWWGWESFNTSFSRKSWALWAICFECFQDLWSGHNKFNLQTVSHNSPRQRPITSGELRKQLFVSIKPSEHSIQKLPQKLDSFQKLPFESYYNSYLDIYFLKQTERNSLCFDQVWRHSLINNHRPIILFKSQYYSSP